MYWLQAASQHIVPVVQKVVSGNRCRHFITGVPDECYCLFGRDVFKDNAQSRKSGGNSTEDSVDKNGFPIEDINILVSHLAVNGKNHIVFLHRFEYGEHFFYCTDTED